MQNYYRLLGVPVTATQADIEQAYQHTRASLQRRLKDPAMRARLQDLETGYNILQHPLRRLAYDVLLAEEPPEPPSRAALAWEKMFHYARPARALNVALVACCLLLGLDWALPQRQFAQERVSGRRIVLVYSPIGPPQLIYKYITPHSTFQLPSKQAHRVQVGQRLTVWSTPLLGEVRRLSAPSSQEGAAPFPPYGGRIYNTFAVLPLLLLAVSGVGALPGRTPETYVNTATVGGLLGLLTFLVVFFF